ncbi:M23 family metallopeptidase [Christiangramia forsetii]|uniref:Secreted peptidase, family M23 n=2 Tax=Christiangramia forsetii TaxID=411153 RepID=A0M2K3_CHRFK|nr:M23 family metallopeptidase [Christiangramia forsetii]GGG38884.1 peptidase M23 [Christiangramia forsetii]CAL66848.1 secreted peptidase, family M23 [Christiangramia forsetii KT0803]
MKSATSLLFLVLFSTLQAQNNLPQDYFQNPLDIPIVLAGTFGELRSNHFHSGLDIKTQQREGLEVRASAAGYVSRINIQHYGYGKALYIQHSNGYTTVYGHLQKLAPKIKEYLRKQQYAKESYEIELFPEAGELAVEQGELIAYSGNTGGSGGPHLHFEIRDGSQRPMNAQMFGLEVPDSRKPLIQGIFAYPLGDDAHVNNSQERQKLNLIPLNDGTYTVNQVEACGEIGFGISTVDQLDGAYNHNGVYRIEATLNGDLVFEIDFDKFSFAETRHLNQLIDYEYYANNRNRVQRLYRTPNNPLSIYGNLSSEGKLNVKDSLDYQYTIRVTDFKGNEKLVRIPIKGQISDQIQKKEKLETEYFASNAKGLSAKGEKIDVYIPGGSLYDDAYLDISFSEEAVKVHKDEIPLHKNFTIGFDVSNYSEEEKNKLFIARISDNGRPSYSTTYKKGNRFTTGTRTFGKYTLARDTTAPRVSPVNFYDGQWISGNETLKVKISDDLSGIDAFRATVNGKFILMEYEYKNNSLTHYFSDNVLTETENDLKVIVTDNVGNTTTYTSKFFRK